MKISKCGLVVISVFLLINISVYSKAEWQSISPLSEGFPIDFDVYSTDADRILILERSEFNGLNATVWRTNDGGINWDHFEPNIPNAFRIRFAGQPEVLIALGLSGEVYRSANGGETFSLVASVTDSEFELNDFIVYPKDPNIGFIIGNNTDDDTISILRSEDNCLSWDMGCDKCIRGSRIGGWSFDRTGNNLFVSGFGLSQGFETFIFNSKDQGNIFEQVFSSEDYFGISSMVGYIGLLADPSRDNAFLSINNLAIIDTGYSAIEWAAGILSTTDAGETWSRVSKIGSIFRANAIVIPEFVEGNLAGFSNYYTYASWGKDSLIINPNAPDEMYTVSIKTQQAYYSLDRGKHWKILSYESLGSEMRKIVVRQIDTRLVAIGIFGCFDSQYNGSLWKNEFKILGKSEWNPDSDGNRIIDYRDLYDFQEVWHQEVK